MAGKPGRSGRKSSIKELTSNVWHVNAWEKDTILETLTEKINSGIYSVRDIFLWHALQKNKGERERLKFADKLIPDRAPEDRDGNVQPLMVIDRGKE